MRSKSVTFPFSAIVGQQRMRLTLLLNAIDPGIGGVLIRGEKGTAKSIAARGLAGLWPRLDVVADCPFGCDPEDFSKQCEFCRKRRDDGETLPVERRELPFVDLPVNATEDRVAGTLDIERALHDGVRALQPGLLARANRGVLYIDEVNLLDDHLTDLLLDAAAMGVNVVEREGLSVSHPARFLLVGTMNPEEGELRPQLLDRFGLSVRAERVTDPERRKAIILRREEFDADPEAFVRKFASEQQKLSQSLKNASENLGRVAIGETMLDLLVRVCVEFGVEGHRADIVGTKAARAIAALEGREAVEVEDVVRALELTLPHRMRRKPFEQPDLDPKKLRDAVEKILGELEETESCGKKKAQESPLTDNL